MRTLLAPLVSAVLVLTGLVLIGGPAAAHNVLVSSDPAEDASLAVGPERVSMTFDQYLQSGQVNQIAVTGPDGTQWARGPVTVEGTTASVAVAPLGPAGRYVVGYRVLSADGHAVSGEIPFRLTRAGAGVAPEPAAPASPAPGEQAGGEAGLPLWAWLVAAGLLLAGGLVLALRLGRQPN